MEKRLFKVIIAVPARLNSTRLPGKILEDINGKPMLLRVLENCKKADGINSLITCTDSIDVVKTISKWGYDALLTPSSCASGSERINNVLDKLIPNHKNDKKTLIINVQGDLPFLDKSLIENMIELFEKFDHPEVITPIYALKNEEIWDPNVVKVLINKEDEAIIFSRSPIPFVRDIEKEKWCKHFNYWGHIGLYGYRGDIIRNWKNYDSSNLEKVEKLEQLRLIESRVSIKCFKVSQPPLAVDTFEDLEEARSFDND